MLEWRRKGNRRICDSEGRAVGGMVVSAVRYTYF
jgi:hypothetical protein